MPSYAPTMADVQERSGLGRPAIVAIAFAIVALLTSLIAVFVVMRRSSEAPPAPAASKTAALVIDHAPLAADVTKLKRDVVEKVEKGVRLKDEGLRSALGLEPGDVITAINGRAIKREFDVYDAVLGLSMMDASIVYVEIERETQPLLVRWRVDGDLRSARRDPIRRPTPVTPNPFTQPADPLIDTIRKVDDLKYEVPRATVDRFLANPDAYARQARIVPIVRSGRQEGYRFYLIAPGSLWATLGLASGDMIRTINGDNPDQFLEHKDATELKIVVARRTGIDETLVISIK